MEQAFCAEKDLSEMYGPNVLVASPIPNWQRTSVGDERAQARVYSKCTLRSVVCGVGADDVAARSRKGLPMCHGMHSSARLCGNGHLLSEQLAATHSPVDEDF